MTRNNFTFSSSLFTIIIVFIALVSGNKLTAQSDIFGFDPMCSGSSSIYRVDPVYSYGCDSYSWSVTNGTIIGPDDEPEVRVVWDAGVTSGTISYSFFNCNDGYDNFTDPSNSETIEIWDYSLLNIGMSFMGSLPNCNTNTVTLNLEHNVLDVDQITGITWVAPPVGQFNQILVLEVALL